MSGQVGVLDLIGAVLILIGALLCLIAAIGLLRLPDVLSRMHAATKPQTLVDLKQGPDGALYYVSWNTGIYKIEYTGTCADATLLPEHTGCADPKASNYDAKLPKAFHDQRLCAGGTAVRDFASRADWLSYDRRSLSISAPGAHRVEFLDLRGRVAATLSAGGPATHAIPALPAAGIYRLRAVSGLGEVHATYSWLGR